MGTEPACDLPCYLMAVGSRAELARRENPGARPNGGLPSRSILIVAPEWPYPPSWGFATRVYNLARQLSQRHRVSLLTYGSAEQAASDGQVAPTFESVHFVPPPSARRSKRRAQAASLFSARSFHAGGLLSAGMEDALEKLLSRGEFDLVQLESSQMASYARVSNVPTALDEHNIEYVLLRRMAAVELSPARKAYAYLEAAKVRREELRAWVRCDGSIFTSDLDLSVMRSEVPAKPACVVPNGVDIEYFSPVREEPEASTVVFTGSINYRPNADAVAFFISDVMPRLLRLRPSTKFLVVGQGAPDWLLRMSSPHVKFTGAVRDVRPYLGRAAVVVAPLRVAGGTRLKILEALSMQKPVVTTTIGGEGLNVIDGEHVSVADDPQRIAEEVARLMADSKSAAELAHNGRRLIESDYSWSVIVHRLEDFHAQLISKETRV